MNDLDSTGNRSVPIVNAGSGADEHPTQALLDIYTLQRSFQFANPKDSPSASKFEELRERKGYDGLTKGICTQNDRLLRRYWPRADGAFAGDAARAV